MSLRTHPLEATETDLARLGGLFAENDDPKEPRALRWRYLENPTGQVFVDLAVDDDAGRVAGAYCVSPARFRVGGQKVLGVQSIDTLTDASYRGRGLFQRLAKSSYARCAERGAALVYGFPNGSSAFGFFERLGWSRLDPVPFLIRPLRAEYVARRLQAPAWLADRIPRRPLIRTSAVAPPRGRELRVVTDFDEQFDGLWEAFASDVDVAVERDHRYLAWRFDANPIGRYKTIGLYERGELLAYTVFRVAKKHGGVVGYVMELLHRSGHWRDGRVALRQALVEMARAGADVALGWCLEHSPNRHAYRAEGFLTFPESLRPIELHFGARHLRAGRTAICNRRSWYLSYCDSDTV